MGRFLGDVATNHKLIFSSQIGLSQSMRHKTLDFVDYSFTNSNQTELDNQHWLAQH